MSCCAECGAGAASLRHDARQGEMVCVECGFVGETVYGEAWETRMDLNSTATHAFEAGGGDEDVRRVARLTSHAAAEIGSMTRCADLKQDVSECALAVFSECVSRPGWKSRKNETLRCLYAACIYHACCISRVHRTPREVAAALRVDFRHFKNMIKSTQSASQAVSRGRGGASGGATLGCSAVVGLMPRLASRMGLRDEAAWDMSRRCAAVMREVRGGVCNHKPESVAAGLILSVLGELGPDAPSERDAAAACGVSLGTARSLAAKIAAELAARGGQQLQAHA